MGVVVDDGTEVYKTCDVRNQIAQCEKQTGDEEFGVAARDAANESTESLLTATSDTGGGE